MPAVNGGDLCLNHDRRRHLSARPKPYLPSLPPTAPLLSFAYMEDHASILDSLNAIAQAFARHSIDHRQARTLTYLMQTCLKTLRQMHEIETAVTPEDAVREVVYNEQDEAFVPPSASSTPSTPAPTSGDKDAPVPAQELANP